MLAVSSGYSFNLAYLPINTLSANQAHPYIMRILIMLNPKNIRQSNRLDLFSHVSALTRL